MLKKIYISLIFLTLFAIYCNAQIYIEPLVGYQTELNNKNKFKQINTALQFSFKTGKHHELILLLQKSWAVPNNSTDSSFSLNPALPVFAYAKKTINPSAISVAMGNRFIIVQKNKKDIFSILIFTGATWQKIAVGYQYDKINYTILNPDQTQKTSGLFLSGGLEYMRLTKMGRFFTQLNFATTPIGGKHINYPSSFGFMAPLSFNVGFSIPLKKNKNAK